MKKMMFSIGALLVVLAVVIGCESSPSSSSYSRPSSYPSFKWKGIVYDGEDEPLVEGTTWNFQNFGEGSDRKIVTVEFRRGGKLVLAETGSGSWQRTDDTIKFVGLAGDLYFEGIYYPKNQRILGTFLDSVGKEYNRTLELAGSSTIASSTNAYVQPSAPAQSAPSAQQQRSEAIQQLQEAFRSPIQSGTYGRTGTQSKISLTAIAKSGILNYTTTDGRAGTGTYSIDGTRMTIKMEGYTFVYTITSPTSFSGHDETWVKIGF